MNGPSQNSFDFGDSNGALSNSAAGYFMGYSALPSSNRQLRSLCAYEGRRLAKLIGGYIETTAEAGSSAPATASIKYNCGGRSPYDYPIEVGMPDGSLSSSNAAAGGGGGDSQGDEGDVIDCARLLMDYSPAGSAADIQALPTARLFKLSAFGA